MRQQRGFTLVELLVSVTLLALMVALLARLIANATNTIQGGQKRIDIDSQVRPLFDRMALDFSQMVQRSDVDFYGKGTTANVAGGTMTGAALSTINDRIAFYSGVPGD